VTDPSNAVARAANHPRRRKAPKRRVAASEGG
jgi:hypothetical protein